MGGLGKDRYQFTGLTNGARYRYLQMRAERLEWTVSKAATRLLDAWFEAGCPPLSKFDTKPPAFHEDQWQTVEKKAKPSSAAATDTILDDEDEKADESAPNGPDAEPPAKRRGSQP